MKAQLNIFSPVAELDQPHESKFIALSINKTLPISTHYSFIDSIRMVSMMGIVWAHISLFSFKKLDYNAFDNISIYLPFMQIWKFGVINFFMISGFLLKEKLDLNHPFLYFKHRIKNILKPYLIAFILCGILTILQLWKHQLLYNSNPSSVLEKLVFQTPFWYIPNYLICLFIIIITSKFINSFYYGLVLLAITLYYSILSVYLKNSYIPHSEVLLGYVFFLWLGYTFNSKNLLNFFLKIKWPILIILILATFALSSYESYILYINSYKSYFSILRISNVLYSIVAFIILAKLFSQTNLGDKFAGLQKNTYGIYLYHYFFVSFIIPQIGFFIERKFQFQIFTYHIKYFILSYLIVFVISYILTNYFIKALKFIHFGFLK